MVCNGWVLLQHDPICIFLRKTSIRLLKNSWCHLCRARHPLRWYNFLEGFLWAPLCQCVVVAMIKAPLSHTCLSERMSGPVPLQSNEKQSRPCRRTGADFEALLQLQLSLWPESGYFGRGGISPFPPSISPSPLFHAAWDASAWSALIKLCLPLCVSLQLQQWSLERDKAFFCSEFLMLVLCK